MNSYMRQPSIPADQMHSFLKDKQAWENAIAMYQGPDPLDHWYNYICWYENHSHGDPENKFRETLERCLTQYEHSDYYKMDPRMVRLWIKYIDMQSNPLHFYEVLHHRGVGRQVAAFYVSWAGYYESVHALKEAEAVYNLGFQEKAQSYAELQHAHNKLIYARSAAAAQQAAQAALQLKQTHHMQLQQQQQQQQQHLHHHHHQIEYQQQQIETQIIHGSPHGQIPMEPTQVQTYRQQVCYQQQMHQMQHPVQSQHQQFYQQQINYQPTQQLQQLQAQQQQQQQQQQQLEQQLEQQQQQQEEEQSQHLNGMNSASSNSPHFIPQQFANVPAEVIPIEQQLPAVTVHSVSQQQLQIRSAAVAQTTIATIEGIKLPRKFATLCRNNYETWKPALFLEEPADPSRICHYAKNNVYPGTGVEYSPEELRSLKYVARLNQREKSLQELQSAAPISEQPQNLQEIGTVGRAKHKEQPHLNEMCIAQAPERYHCINGIATTLTQSENELNNENDYVENNENDVEEYDDDDDEDDEEEDDDDLSENFSQQKKLEEENPVNTIVDLEEQIEASTIRFSMHTSQQGSQNKTIKIKFKKEQPQSGNSLNGSGNYSAYTIENIYQQNAKSSDFAGQESNTPRRNDHSFHPYGLGQTSTPKTSSKRSKTKLKRVNNKFQAPNCSSSNSSSTENGPTTNTNTADSAFPNASFNDNANYSFSSAVALDHSNCSLTSAVGRLNFRDAMTASSAAANHQSANTVADFSTYQENSYFATQHDAEAKELRLQKALETIDRHMAKEAIDPFSSDLCRAFLTKLDFPGIEDAHANYKIIQTPLPKIANTRTLSLPDGVHFLIDKEVGRGSYGSVYKATDASGAVVALKFQKPPNTWEIYICDQVLKRIRTSSVLPGLMDISTAIIAPNASLIATQFSPFGSLLDINNKIRQSTTKVMHESLVMHFSAQICNIIHHLHLNKIIHADIKPDNFLLMRIPNTDLHYPSLRLIDFGCAIDMTLFPQTDKTKFRKVIQTDGFTCIEMQEGRPWSYETDLFCIAGTVHVMLLGEYMQLQKRAGAWDIKQKLPRYLKKDVWSKFFGEMLNIQGAVLPDLSELRYIFEEEAAKMDSELQSQIRTLSNILYRR